jgi:hypothetical protein
LHPNENKTTKELKGTVPEDVGSEILPVAMAHGAIVLKRAGNFSNVVT